MSDQNGTGTLTRAHLLAEARDLAHLRVTAVETLMALVDCDQDTAERALEAIRHAPTVRTLADILADPDALKPPASVVPRMVWESRVTLMAMREKGGKSTTAGGAAAAVSGGGWFLGERCTAGDVLWFNLEEFTGDLATRLHRFGADPERIHIVDHLEDPLRDFETLVYTVRPSLVVIDTLAAFADLMADSPDPGSSAGWTPIMAGLARPTREAGAGLLLLHHARKSDGEYRDSTAIGAGVDMILTVGEDGDDGARKVKARGRWSLPDYTFSLVGERFQLGGGELAVEARVLTYVINNPGCSTRGVRDGVSARNEEIDDAIRTLIRAESVHDHGGARGREMYAPPACPAPCPTCLSRAPQIALEAE